jgi:hypothetical protein
MTRLPLTIPFEIPTYWTPEQALAVFELLNDLRDRVWKHYSLQLHELVTGEIYQPSQADDPDSHALENDDF